MKHIIQFHIYKGDTHYIAQGIDLPIVTQGETLDELMDNLKEAVDLHLEGENLEKLDLAPHPAVIANIELPIAAHA